DPAHGGALELLAYARRGHRDVPVILLFSREHPDRAKEAMRQGAMAVLSFPVPAAELRASVLQALDRSGGRPARDPVGGGSPAPASPAAGSESPAIVVPDPGPGADPGPSAAAMQRLEQIVRELGLIGRDPTWRQAIDLAGALAATRAPVLIL